MIDARKTLLASKKENNLIKITADDEKEFFAEAMTTIISSGDTIGSVVICGKDESWQSDVMKQIAQTAAQFLGRQME